jgi:hypothetical protein
MCRLSERRVEWLSPFWDAAPELKRTFRLLADRFKIRAVFAAQEEKG